MGLFLKYRRESQPAAVIGLDLGSSQIKAIALRRLVHGSELTAFSVSRAHSVANAQELGGKIAEVLGELGAPRHNVRVAISGASAKVWSLKVPRAPLAEIRRAIRLNPRRYLLQDIKDSCVDVADLTTPSSPDTGTNTKHMRILVAAAARDEVAWHREALRAAKIKPASVTLSAVSVINAFSFGHMQTDKPKLLLLLDIGSRSTSITFLQCGQPVMTRILPFGTSQLNKYVTRLLAQASARSTHFAGAPAFPIQHLIKEALAPLADEIRRSADFFETECGYRIGRVMACGGAACSQKLLSLLGKSLQLHIESWNPIERLETGHFNGQTPRLLAIAPSLAAAVGAAASSLDWTPPLGNSL